MKLNKVHHIAIICTDYQKSKRFYTEILGFDILNEVYETAYKNKEISDDLITELRDLQWDFSHFFILVCKLFYNCHFVNNMFSP